MSHKNKKYSHANLERFQRDQMEQQQARSESSMNPVTKGVIGGGTVLAGIGIATGATALYLLKTERGREISSQVRETVNDAVCRLQERFTDTYSSVKDGVSQLAERWNISTGSSEDASQSENINKLRRVV